MSKLRAKCPYCRTLTAVSVGLGYECHACGRTFEAGLVRVPQAWGVGGEPMHDGARLPLPYPEVAVIEEDTLREQNLALAAALPERPLVLGGCCCSHIGAVEGLAARHGRVAVVWLDAHGDLNTPETSPSGNLWGMPLRMLIDSETVRPEDVVLIGARDLDPPEDAFIAEAGVHLGVEELDAAIDDADAVYVALDVDVLDPGGEVVMFMPAPDGLTGDEVRAILERIADSRTRLVGFGISAATGDESNVEALVPFARAIGL
jgi:arginase